MRKKNLRVRRIAAYFTMPLLVYYTEKIIYEVARYQKYGWYEIDPPWMVVLAFIVIGLGIWPATIVFIALYSSAFYVYVKLEEKFKIHKLHQYVFFGAALGFVGYVPFLLFPSSLSNWKYSVYYLSIYSFFYWCFIAVPALPWEGNGKLENEQ